jgi:hypothetical protein
MKKEIGKLQDIFDTAMKELPSPVVFPSTLGNQLQNTIIKHIIITNLLMFYLCLFATIRLITVGN